MTIQQDISHSSDAIEEAKKSIDEMDPGTRALYEEA